VKTLAPLFAAALVVSLAGCGTSAAPNPTSPTNTTPPTASNLTGRWTGSGTDPQGPENLTWAVTQSGTNLSGIASIVPGNTTDGSCGSCHKLKDGTLSGTMVGGALTLTLDFPEGGADLTPLCGITITATTSDVTDHRIAASYSGTTTCEGPIAGGSLVMTR
jgi:hypothetical protein